MLLADLGVVHMMLVLQAFRMQELWVVEASSEISKESLGRPGGKSWEARRYVAGSETLQLCEARAAKEAPGS